MTVRKTSLSVSLTRNDQTREISNGDLTQTPTLAHKELYVAYKSNKQSYTNDDIVKLGV
jgi:hypothetical protein